MTTIVYRAGLMAADSRAYQGDKWPIGFKQKIKRLADGRLAGVSSSTPGLGELVLAWVEAGMDTEKTPDVGNDWFDCLIVDPEGQGYFARSNFFFAGPLQAEWFAVGSGAEVAKGALLMGATAEEAVGIAAQVDPYTGGPIITLTHISK